MAQFPDYLRIEMELSTDTWTDVSRDVVTPVTGQEGIMSFGPLDRVAGGGSMSFFMDNGTTNSAGLSGYYTPGHTNARAGFEAGTNVRLYVDYEGYKRYRFYGKILPGGIGPATGEFDSRLTAVRAGDWMTQAAKHDIVLPEFAQNKTAAEVVALVVANMPIAPLNTEYNACQDTFPFVFDTVRDRTKALAEIFKAIISEGGYCYIKHDATGGEVLVVEGRHTRNAKTIKQLPKIDADEGFLNLSGDTDGFLLLKTGGKIVLNATQDASYDNNMISQPPLSHGKYLSNEVSAVTYPREVDTDVVLFTWQQPSVIGAGTTKDGIRGRYRDPTGGASKVSGRDMMGADSDGVLSTDYWTANTDSDDSGMDVSSDISIAVDYGTEAAEYAITNSGPEDIWITTLTAEGTGVFLYDPVQIKRIDSDSQALHGVRPLKYSLPYQANPSVGENFADFGLQNLKDPSNEPEPPWFNANTSAVTMAGWLILDIGDIIELKEDITGIDGNYYIQGFRWRIEDNNVIYWSPVVKAGDFITYWQLGVVGASEIGETTRVGF